MAKKKKSKDELPGGKSGTTKNTAYRNPAKILGLTLKISKGKIRLYMEGFYGMKVLLLKIPIEDTSIKINETLDCKIINGKVRDKINAKKEK